VNRFDIESPAPGAEEPALIITPAGFPAFNAVPALAVFVERMDLLAVKAVGSCGRVSRSGVVAVNYCY